MNITSRNWISGAHHSKVNRRDCHETRGMHVHRPQLACSARAATSVATTA